MSETRLDLYRAAALQGLLAAGEARRDENIDASQGHPEEIVAQDADRYARALEARAREDDAGEDEAPTNYELLSHHWKAETARLRMVLKHISDISSEDDVRQTVDLALDIADPGEEGDGAAPSGAPGEPAMLTCGKCGAEAYDSLMDECIFCGPIDRVNQAIRDSGGDPEAIGHRGEALADALRERNDLRRANETLRAERDELVNALARVHFLASRGSDAWQVAEQALKNARKRVAGHAPTRGAASETEAGGESAQAVAEKGEERPGPLSDREKRLIEKLDTVRAENEALKAMLRRLRVLPVEKHIDFWSAETLREIRSIKRGAVGL